MKTPGLFAEISSKIVGNNIKEPTKKDEALFRKISSEMLSGFAESVTDEAKSRGKAMAEGFYEQLMIMDSIYNGSLFKASAAVAEYDIPVALQSKNDFMKLGALAVGGEHALHKLNKRSFDTGYTVMSNIMDALEVENLKKTSAASREQQHTDNYDLLGLLKHRTLAKVSESKEERVLNTGIAAYDLNKLLREKKLVKQSYSVVLKKESMDDITEEDIDIVVSDPEEVGTIEFLPAGEDKGAVEAAATAAAKVAGEAAASTAAASIEEETGETLSPEVQAEVENSVRDNVTEGVKNAIDNAVSDAASSMAEEDPTLVKSSKSKVTLDDLQAIFDNGVF